MKNKSKHALNKKICLTIYDIGQKIEMERQEQKNLLYEASVTASLKQVAKDPDEKDKWEMEERILDSMIKRSINETDLLLDELSKQTKKLGLIESIKQKRLDIAK